MCQQGYSEWLRLQQTGQLGQLGNIAHNQMMSVIGQQLGQYIPGQHSLGSLPRSIERYSYLFPDVRNQYSLNRCEFCQAVANHEIYKVEEKPNWLMVAKGAVYSALSKAKYMVVADWYKAKADIKRLMGNK